MQYIIRFYSYFSSPLILSPQGQSLKVRLRPARRVIVLATLYIDRRTLIYHVLLNKATPGSCCSVGYSEIKKLLVEEVSRKTLDVSECLSVLEGSGKVKPCKNALCSLGRAKLEVFVKGVMSGLGELPSSI